MSTVPLRPRPSGHVYIDVLGQRWSTDKLDGLIADPAVASTVIAGVSMGLRPDRTWCPTSVLTWARLRYPRESPAALLLLLVTRYFDTAGAHYLGRGSVG